MKDWYSCKHFLPSRGETCPESYTVDVLIWDGVDYGVGYYQIDESADEIESDESILKHGLGEWVVGSFEDSEPLFWTHLPEPPED